VSSISGTNWNTDFRGRGLSGLVSGMDTDSMVEKMLQGTQTKIDRQNGAKQRLQWKQTLYQSVIKKINTLKSKYFDSSYDADISSNLLSGKFFSSMVSTVKSGDSVRVVGSSSAAQPGETTVLVSQLASAAKLSSDVKMSGDQKITGGAMDIDAIKSTLSSGEELSFDITLDGMTKSITFSEDDFPEGVDKSVNAANIKTVLDGKLSRAFGSYVSADMADNKLSFSINIKGTDEKPEPGHELRITGADAAKFGIEPGSSSLFQLSTKLGGISGVSGKGYNFSINGKKFSFSADDTVGTMINKINSSDAGVKIAYSSVTDSFSLTAASTGARYGISVTQESGNLLTVMLGDKISAGTSAESCPLNSAVVVGNETGLSAEYTTTGASMTFKVNGKNYTFTLEKRDTAYNKAEVESKLNSWLTSTFGKAADGVANISYADGKLTTAAGYLVSFEKTEVTDENELEKAGRTDLSIAMGFAQTGATNAVNGDMDITAAVGIPGYDTSIYVFRNSAGAETTKLSEIKTLTYNGTNYNVSFLDGKVTLSGAAGGTINFDGTGFANFFGDKVTFGTGKIAEGAVAPGTDTEVTINGVKTTRSSNTFTFEGLTITATKVSPEQTVIGTVRDTDKIVDAVKSFVEDYNKLADELYGYMTEDAEYKNYAPLTDAQKKEMSDDEIKRWTEKAKTGLLRSDPNIGAFLRSMRSAFYTKVESAGLAGYSIGIETTEKNLSGKLTLNETLLRGAIASDPEAVGRLFTDSENGLATQLGRTCEEYAKLSMSSPGSLVRIAGAEGYTAYSKQNDMYFELGRINDKLRDLQTKYEKERTRYWNKFNAMESIIAQYSSQSSMITSTFFSNN